MVSRSVNRLCSGRLFSRFALALAAVGLFAVGIFGQVQPAQATAGINSTINYQGRLLTATGAVVPDGNYNMEFKIYQDGPGNVAGDTGGTLKWTEDWINASSNGVTVKNGYFSVTLGSITALSSVDFNQQTLWLSMSVANGTDKTSSCTPYSSCTHDAEMLPMKRLSSTPYAINSGALGGLSSGQFVQLAQGIQTASVTSNPAIGINATSGTNNLITLQSSGTDVFDVASTGNLQFGNNANKTISVATAASGNNGNSLTVQGGSGNGTNKNGGNLVLQGGNSTGTGTPGSVIVRSQTNSTTAFQVQNSSSTTLLNVDTTNSVVTVNAGLQVTSNNSSQNSSTVLVQNTGTGNATLELRASSDSYYVGVDTNNGGAFSIGSGYAANAGSVTIGDKTVEAGSDDCYSNICTIQVTTGATAGSTSSISLYATAVDGVNPGVQVAIYTNNSGSPGTLVANSASQTLTTGWNTIPISATLSGTTSYWIAYNQQGNGTYVAYGGSGSTKYTSQAYGTWPSSPTSWGTDSGGLHSMYLTYSSTSTANDYNGALLTISQSGQTKLQNATDSTQAFQIQNAAGTSNLFDADTTNNRIGIGKATPGYTLDVAGDINSSTALRIGGTAVCISTGCTPDATSNSFIQNGASPQAATFNITGNGTTSGVFAASSLTASNTVAISGTTTSTNNKLSIVGSVNSTSTSTQYAFQNQVSFSPTGASLGNLYGLVNIPSVAGSAVAIGNAYGAYSRLDTTSGYTGQITNGASLVAGAPSIAGSKIITNYSGVQVDSNSSNGGNTTGTINNYGLKVYSNGAAAGTGGTLNNYSAYLQLASSTGGTTNNYGLYIQGNGGGSSTYSIYNNSTAASYFAGKIGIGNTNPQYPLDVTGDINATGTLRAPNVDTASAGTLTLGGTTANAISLGQNTTIASGKTLLVQGATTIQTSAASTSAFAVNFFGGGNLLKVDNSTSSGEVIVGSAAVGTSRFSVNAGSQVAIGANQTGSSDILDLQSSGVNVLTVSSTGTLTVKPSSTSATAFQVQGNANNGTLFNLDSTDGYTINNGTTNPGNLLQNPGFEAGTGNAATTGWSGSAQATTVADAVNARTGSNEYQITPNGSAISASTAEYYAVTPGDTYYISGYSKAASGTNGGATISASLTDINKTGSTFTSITANNTTSYVFGSTTVTIPAGKAFLRVAMTANTSSTTGTWYFDDLTLTKVNQSNPLIVKPAVDSTNVVQIQNAAGTSNLFVADTTDTRIGIGTATPGYTLDVAGDINTTGVFRVAGATGSTTTCTSNNVLQNPVVTGGIVTGGTCAVNGAGVTMQNTYDNSASPATILLANAKNYVINAADTATDPNILFNLQCVTSCSTNGRFAVQNAGVDVFKVNPNGTIVLGSGSNNTTIAATGELTLNGTAQHTRRITLTAEYAGAVLDAGTGSNNTGTMTSGVDATNRMNYYKWTTSSGTSQSYDVVVQVPIPSDFSSWASGSFPGVTYNDYSSTITTNTIQADIIASDGTDTGFCDITPAFTNSWNNSLCIPTSGTYTAGGYMTLRIRMTSPTSGNVRIGNITVDYMSKW